MDLMDSDSDLSGLDGVIAVELDVSSKTMDPETPTPRSPSVASSEGKAVPDTVSTEYSSDEFDSDFDDGSSQSDFSEVILNQDYAITNFFHFPELYIKRKCEPFVFLFDPEDLLRRRSNRESVKRKFEDFTSHLSAEDDDDSYHDSDKEGLETDDEEYQAEQSQAKRKKQTLEASKGEDLPFKCPHCPRIFSKELYLNGHLVAHSDERPFECPLCDKAFGKQHHLKSHITHRHGKEAFLNESVKKLVPGLAPFKCTACSKSFSLDKELVEHCNSAHNPPKSNSTDISCLKQKEESTSIVLEKVNGPPPDSPSAALPSGQMSRIQCPHCSRTFSKPMYLKSHLVIHSTDKPFKCQHCPKAFATEYHLKGHMTHRHSNQPVPVSQVEERKVEEAKDINTGIPLDYKCLYCVKSFVMIGRLKSHILKYHQKDAAAQALILKLQDGYNLESYFINGDRVDDILNKPSTPEDESPMDPTTESPTVGNGADPAIISAIKPENGLPISDENKAKPFTCPTCNQAFTRPNYLKSHIFYKHTRKRSASESTSGSTGSDLQKPVSSTSPVSSTQTDTPEKQESKARQRRSSTSNPENAAYACLHCPRKFVLKAHLVTHMVSHRDTRPHLCLFCDKSYGTPHHLKMHVNLKHPSEHFFSCPKCSQVFAKEEDFKDHEASEHPKKVPLDKSKNERFPCQLCDEKFTSKTLLKKHTKDSHSPSKPQKTHVSQRVPTAVSESNDMGSPRDLVSFIETVNCTTDCLNLDTGGPTSKIAEGYVNGGEVPYSMTSATLASDAAPVMTSTGNWRPERRNSATTLEEYPADQEVQICGPASSGENPHNVQGSDDRSSQDYSQVESFPLSLQSCGNALFSSPLSPDTMSLSYRSNFGVTTSGYSPLRGLTSPPSLLSPLSSPQLGMALEGCSENTTFSESYDVSVNLNNRTAGYPQTPTNASEQVYAVNQMVGGGGAPNGIVPGMGSPHSTFDLPHPVPPSMTFQQASPYGIPHTRPVCLPQGEPMEQADYFSNSTICLSPATYRTIPLEYIQTQPSWHPVDVSHQQINPPIRMSPPGSLPLQLAPTQVSPSMEVHHQPFGYQINQNSPGVPPVMYSPKTPLTPSIPYPMHSPQLNQGSPVPFAASDYPSPLQIVEQIYKPPSCSIQTAPKEVKQVVSEEVFVCPHCTESFSNKINLASHVVTHGNGQAPPTIRDHKCSYCKKSYETKEQLETHVNRRHDTQDVPPAIEPPREKPFKCGQCPKAFYQDHHLKSHIYFKHTVDESVPTKLSNGMYQCNRCDRTFEYEYRLKSHMYHTHVSQSADESAEIN